MSHRRNEQERLRQTPFKEQRHIAMKHISIGGLDVSRIGLGAMSMSDYYNIGAGSDAESIHTIHRALDTRWCWPRSSASSRIPAAVLASSTVARRISVSPSRVPSSGW